MLHLKSKEKHGDGRRNGVMGKITVIISDPHILFREGIHFVLSGEDEFEVTGETTSNEEAFNLIETNPPDIAFLSMQDGKNYGPEITRKIKRSLPSISVVLITDRKDENNLFDAIRSGVNACLTKDTNPEELLEIIRNIADGRYPIVEELMMPGLAAKVLAEFEDMTTLSEKLDNLLARLSPGEQLILSNLVDGNTFAQISYKMDTDVETVRHGLITIVNKLISNDQARALIEAAQRSMPAIVRGIADTGGNDREYVTKSEFNEFKEHLMERVKSLFGELGEKVFPQN
jgi:two-component system response regulator DevR